MTEPWKPAREEIKFFLTAVLVTAGGFIGYKSGFDIQTAGFYLIISTLILLTREIGQRLIAQSMHADVELKLSLEGSMTTVFGAFIAVVTSLPIILIFPVQNSFSTNKYEQWGKSVDAIWLKRKYWLVSGGIMLLFLLWLILYSFGFSNGAEAVSLFLLFQMMPFDYPSIPTGNLDGATILRQSGFIWLLYMGLIWTTLAIIWV